MQIVNGLGERYEAKQVKARMVKTFIVDVYLDDGSYAEQEWSEEELEAIAHEDWLEAQAAILKAVADRFPYIDIEFSSTDNIQLEVVK